ncbi:hypothetical protein EVAR_77147_1 [Eumeta japonica]|uniref:Uncharacterized protein n=1 Tax=Eumeta variegata TaxID=151549 RepID=A0A4C1T1V3_EUMVA|nr:hypothetical protein EVAR_77147_1 [Eumeta japonica]
MSPWPVSISSSSIGDGLQTCHTAAKELRGNASLLSARVAALEAKHTELALKVQAAIEDLAAVTKQLADAPSLANTPRRMAELQQTVANFGSQIQGFDIAVEQAHKQSTAATTALEEVKATLQRVEARANQTSANMTERVKLFRELKQRIDDVNGTLVTRIEALQARIENNTSPTTTSTTTTTPAASSPAPAPASQESRPAPPTQPPTKIEGEATVPPTRVQHSSISYPAHDSNDTYRDIDQYHRYNKSGVMINNRISTFYGRILQYNTGDTAAVKNKNILLYLAIGTKVGVYDKG